MAKRRVGASPEVGDNIQYDPDMLRGLLQLADLDALSGAEAQTGANDLMGTSQEPKNFTEVSGVPQFENIQTVPPKPQAGQAYLDSVEAISKLPQMANQNPAPVENPNMAKSLSVNQNNLPRDGQGKLVPPLDFIKSRVQEDPSLMELLPEETQSLVNPKPQMPAPIPENAMGRLGDLFNRFKNYVENPEPEQQSLEGGTAKEINPPTETSDQVGYFPKEESKIIPPEQEITTEIVDQHQDKTPQANAVQEAKNDPQIMKDLERLNGMQGISDEYLEGAEKWQNVLTARQETLNEEERGLLAKAESGELTTLDKVMIGIAVAIPILMSLRYGINAGLASAGEGLKGYADVQLKQQKSDQERNEKSKKRLGEIQEERLKLAEKNIDIDKKLIEAIPNKEVREFLKNKKVQIIGDKIGISTGDEGDALWFDAKQMDESAEGIKEARKNLSEAKDTIGLVNKSNAVLDEIKDILDAMPEDTGVWEAIKANKGWFTSLGGKNPFGGEPLMIDVKDKNGKVRQVNAFEMLKQKMTAMQDVYNKVNLGKTALTSNVLQHWDGILVDPKDFSGWFAGNSLQTVKDKTESLKDFLNQGAIEGLTGHGFLRGPLEQKYSTKQIQPLKSQESVINDMRANPKAYMNKVK